MAMNSSIAGLLVSWDVAQEVYGSIQYHVISDQNLTCKSTSSSCTLWAAGCGETHTMQVSASNKAGPSQPSSPVFFITCESKGNLGIYELLTMIISSFELVVLSAQTLALQAHYSWWSHLKEIAHFIGQRFFMQTVTRPSLKGVMAVKRPATPPETTAHTAANVATPT